MNLNERAAKCMGWTLQRIDWHDKNVTANREWVNADGDRQFVHHDADFYEPSELWDPEHDYNHARMLYERVVERGLEDELAEAVCEYDLDIPSHKDAFNVFDALNMTKAPLRLTAAHLTEACCEVLEASNER